MNRQDRAKQFLPFDAMKGLQEALEREEERLSREERTELGEEDAEVLSRLLSRLARGVYVDMEWYLGGHYVRRRGKVTEIDFIMRVLSLEGEKIYFDDIRRLEIISSHS